MVLLLNQLITGGIKPSVFFKTVSWNILLGPVAEKLTTSADAMI